MDTILQSQVFFFISSVGFVLLWAMVAIFLYYIIRVARAFSRIMDMIEGHINTVGDVTKEMLSEMKDNPIFKFFFNKKRKSRKD
jgi:hypothetical protein